MSDPTRDPRDALNSITRLALCVTVFVAAGMVAARALGATPDGPTEPQILAHGAGCVAVCLATIALPARARLLPPRGAARAPLYYVAFLLAWVPSTLFGYTWLLQQAGVTIDAQPQLAYFAGADRHRWQFLAATATVVLAGPLAEEIVFRGHLRDILRASLGRRAGLAGTALLFGVFHGLVLALPIALLGLLFGWLRERYDSLAPAVVVHALHNGVTVVVVTLWPHIFDAIYR